MKWIRNWFSNYEPLDTPLEYDGLQYATVEHFYQAMKSTDDGYRALVSRARFPSLAKKMGRHVKIRPDWEDIKHEVMEHALRHKFRWGTHWRAKLSETQGEIVEHNNWHDNHWGDCCCPRCKYVPGKNHLGRLLMKIRDDICS